MNNDKGYSSYAFITAVRPSAPIQDSDKTDLGQVAAVCTYRPHRQPSFAALKLKVGANANQEKELIHAT